jgi:hypothetical protein
MDTTVVLGLQVLRRASAFLAEEKEVAAKIASIPKHVEALNGATARVETLAREQDEADRSFRMAALACRESAQTLLREHVRPVCIMGELLFPVGSPVHASFKRPPSDVGYDALLSAAESIATLAAEHKTMFIDAGFLEDFIERLRGEVAVLRQKVDEAAAHRSRRVATRAARSSSLKRARKMLRLLNTMVAPQLKSGDSAAKWKSLSRFKHSSKRNGEEVQGETPSTPVVTGGTSTPEGNRAA